MEKRARVGSRSGHVATLTVSLVLLMLGAAYGGDSVVELVELAPGVTVAKGTLGGSPFFGDSFDFQHRLAATADGASCETPHFSSTGSNVVVFDGQVDFLDPYANGTQPFVFEVDTGVVGGGVSTFEIFTSAEGDLFPAGFVDEAGNPLRHACFVMGSLDALVGGVPAAVISAEIALMADGVVTLAPVEFGHLLPPMWDGTMQILIEDLAGQGTEVVQLSFELQLHPGHLFSDGFESGDVSSWSSDSAKR